MYASNYSWCYPPRYSRNRVLPLGVPALRVTIFRAVGVVAATTLGVYARPACGTVGVAGTHQSFVLRLHPVAASSVGALDPAGTTEFFGALHVHYTRSNGKNAEYQ